MKQLFAIAVIAALGISTNAHAEWEPTPGNKAHAKVAKAVAAFKEEQPKSQMYFDEAYGYAIYPGVTRLASGFGGAVGKGLVFEGDKLVGFSRYWQFTSGIQAGIKNFSMIVFFKDKEALEYFQLSKAQFMGQAGIDFFTVGAASTPAYNEGVAILTMTRFGIMGEFSVSGAKFTYRSLEEQAAE